MHIVKDSVRGMFVFALVTASVAIILQYHFMKTELQHNLLNIKPLQLVYRAICLVFKI